MASIDLSVAFDVINIGLLVKRLNIIGIPSDGISLIETWLSNRLFYFSIDDCSSWPMTSNTGTIQGSILGPVFYAIYVSPLFELQQISNFADDNFVLRWKESLEAII